MTVGGPVRRIRTPHPHDVLSGRGGGINAHPGNKVFREWVHLRKEDYNLAPNKKEKTRVAEEVMDQVRQQDPPGRFLQKDNSMTSGPTWWIEVSEERALAKTSQALREGAPQIRQEHAHELAERVATAKRSSTGGGGGGGKRKRKSTTTSKQQATSTKSSSDRRVPPSMMAPPKPLRRLPTDEYNQAMENLQANVQEAKSLAAKQDSGNTQQQQQQQQTRLLPPPPPPPSSFFQQKYYSPINKRARIDAPINVQEGKQSNYNNNNNNGDPYVDSFGETPPLMAVPTPPINDDSPPLRLDSSSRKRGLYQYGKNGSTGSSNNGLQRVHSLALSDFSMSDTNVFDEEGSFVNPFEDESDIANKVLLGKNHKSNNKNGSAPLRNISSSGETPTTTTTTTTTNSSESQQPLQKEQPSVTSWEMNMNPRYVIEVDGDYLEDEWLPSSNSNLVPFS